MKDNAYKELMEILDGEAVESLIISAQDDDESEPPLVPHNLQGKLIPLESLEPYMGGWNFRESRAYHIAVWTKTRVIFCVPFLLHEDCYDDKLSSVPRHPSSDLSNVKMPHEC